MDLAKVVLQIAEDISALSPMYADLLRALPQLRDVDLSIAITRVMDMGMLCGDPPAPTSAPLTGACMVGSIWCGAGHSSAWSMLAFLRHPDDFVACVRFAVSGGGDTDTTAAMAGALCGARVGVHGIPTAWLAGIHDQGQWSAVRLVALCDAAQEAVSRWASSGPPPQ
jgi:hypothetical protein